MKREQGAQMERATLACDVWSPRVAGIWVTLVAEVKLIESLLITFACRRRTHNVI
jgi:hypothetical protein